MSKLTSKDFEWKEWFYQLLEQKNHSREVEIEKPPVNIEMRKKLALRNWRGFIDWELVEAVIILFWVIRDMGIRDRTLQEKYKWLLTAHNPNNWRGWE